MCDSNLCTTCINFYGSIFLRLCLGMFGLGSWSKKTGFNLPPVLKLFSSLLRGFMFLPGPHSWGHTPTSMQQTWYSSFQNSKLTQERVSFPWRQCWTKPLYHIPQLQTSVDIPPFYHYWFPSCPFALGPGRWEVSPQPWNFSLLWLFVMKAVLGTRKLILDVWFAMPGVPRDSRSLVNGGLCSQLKSNGTKLNGWGSLDTVSKCNPMPWLCMAEWQTCASGWKGGSGFVDQVWYEEMMENVSKGLIENWVSNYFHTPNHTIDNWSWLHIQDIVFEKERVHGCWSQRWTCHEYIIIQCILR